MKAAATDALKKACSLFGIGLEMYAGSTGDADHSAGPNREPASEKGKAGGGGPTDDRNRLTAKQLKAIFAIGHVKRMTEVRSARPA